jgi:hypothetical protein
MSDNKPIHAPSRRILSIITISTFLGAIILTVLFILPAEFGVDPTGLGEKTGLIKFSDATGNNEAGTRTVEGQYPEVTPEDVFDYFEPETLGEPFSRPQNTPVRSEKMTIALEEFEQVEVKAVMGRGDAIVYSWKLTEGEIVYSDFHADPHDVDSFPELYFVRYHESEEAREAGSLIAPFRGNHGWYWLNIEETPITIELQVHGYFESLEEIMRSFQ